MKPIHNFAECLKETLSQNRLSASELSRRMHFSSRNSLFRIINNEASYEKQEEFFLKLRGSGVLSLSPQEWERLEEGLEVSRVGVDHYMTNQAMTEMVMQSGASSDPIQVIWHGEEAGEPEDLAACLEKVFLGEESRLLIVGCCDSGLFRILERLIHGAREQGKETKILHYIEATDVDLVRAIASIQPVIFDSCYEAYTLAEGALTDETRALYRGNLMLASYRDECGRRRFLHLILSDYGRMHGYEDEDGTHNLFLWKVLTEHAKRMAPVKAAFMHPVSPEDYLWYTEQYRELEEDSNLYDIKGDVPINYIHPDLLLGPVREGFKDSGFGREDMQEQFIAELYEIQLRRWQNFFEKHKVTHTIFTVESMRQFALTGLQSDHFFAMRPYTRSERKQILQFIREQTADNPYFTVYFFRQGLEPVQNEIGMYEGKGILLTKAHTDYKLDAGHAEALITQTEFCSSFKSYFLKHLLARDVTGGKETLDILDELIAMCDKSGRT